MAVVQTKEATTTQDLNVGEGKTGVNPATSTQKSSTPKYPTGASHQYMIADVDFKRYCNGNHSTSLVLARTRHQGVRVKAL